MNHEVTWQDFAYTYPIYSSHMDWIKLGRNIKYYRRRKELHQRELAHLLDIGVNTVSRLEIGSIPCSLELLLSLCDILEITPDTLLSGNYNPINSRHYNKFMRMKGVIKNNMTSSIREYFENI